MSTYARQFLDQMERPPVDDMRNVLPAVALEAKNAVTQRALDGRHDHRDPRRPAPALHPPRRGRTARTGTARRGASPPSEAAADARRRRGGRALHPGRPRRRGPKRGADAGARRAVRQGFARRLERRRGGARWSRARRWPTTLDPLPLVLGRFRADAESAVGAASPRRSRTPGGSAPRRASRRRRGRLGACASTPRARLPGLRRDAARGRRRRSSRSTRRSAPARPARASAG